MAIPRLISAAQGRTLVLFTSYESLRSAHNTAVHVLKGFSGLIMKQVDDDNYYNYSYQLCIIYPEVCILLLIIC